MNYLDYFKNKRVMIAGGGGFLGSFIHNELKKVDCEVFIPRTKEGIDFREYISCRSYIESKKPQLLINCAANQGGIGYHKGRQAELFMDNMLMGLYLMKAAQEGGVEKFVNVVAGCAYPGYLEKEELEENDFWNGQLHESVFSYGFPRKASVMFGLALKKQYNFNSIHLVLANMYGPGEHFNPEQSKALAAIIKKCYEAKKNNAPTIEIWGTGKPIRDWLYVKDGAEGILRAAAIYESQEPLNIASGKGLSIKELAEYIKNTVGYKGEIVYNREKSDGALKKVFSVKKMEKALDWLPQTSLEKGIRETVDWFTNHYDYAITH